MAISQILMPIDLGGATLHRWIEAIEAADRKGWQMVVLAAGDPGDPLDGLAIAAWCASRTGSIKLCASLDPDTVEPFTLARGLATLDHLSGGRAAWRLAGQGDDGRAAELAGVVNRLLTSWDADALREDAGSGLLSDAEAVHQVNHDGAFFSVRGPLNIPRPPQGLPPRVALPGDPGAEGADVLAEDRVLRLTIDQALEILA
jgi:alkanesulfonate monooxygenase SsuD/methylene tetrahydromethanopterin reductase-like flavin-dependent oxidoreductase (luciferase family)